MVVPMFKNFGLARERFNKDWLAEIYPWQISAVSPPSEPSKKGPWSKTSCVILLMDSLLATSPEACPPIPSATNARNKPSALMHFIASSLFERSP